MEDGSVALARTLDWEFPQLKVGAPRWDDHVDAVHCWDHDISIILWHFNPLQSSLTGFEHRCARLSWATVVVHCHHLGRIHRHLDRPAARRLRRGRELPGGRPGRRRGSNRGLRASRECLAGGPGGTPGLGTERKLRRLCGGVELRNTLRCFRILS